MQLPLHHLFFFAVHIQMQDFTDLKYVSTKCISHLERSTEGGKKKGKRNQLLLNLRLALTSVHLTLRHDGPELHSVSVYVRSPRQDHFMSLMRVLRV